MHAKSNVPISRNLRSVRYWFSMRVWLTRCERIARKYVCRATQRQSTSHGLERSRQLQVAQTCLMTLANRGLQHCMAESCPSMLLLTSCPLLQRVTAPSQHCCWASMRKGITSSHISRSSDALKPVPSPLSHDPALAEQLRHDATLCPLLVKTEREQHWFVGAHAACGTLLSHGRCETPCRPTHAGASRGGALSRSAPPPSKSCASASRCAAAHATEDERTRRDEASPSLA
mmetsp:Transcript_38342/g.93141  ORF Transcript_38342/g.93141 Transcript_38342/m.93141 type:complete len:231 (+) Transcript_38342:41-733(+)